MTETPGRSDRDSLEIIGSYYARRAFLLFFTLIGVLGATLTLMPIVFSILNGSENPWLVPLVMSPLFLLFFIISRNCVAITLTKRPIIVCVHGGIVVPRSGVIFGADDVSIVKNYVVIVEISLKENRTSLLLANLLFPFVIATRSKIFVSTVQLSGQPESIIDSIQKSTNPS